MEVSIEKGALYVTATPIGNLGDLSPRGRAVLAGVDRIAAEDTRRSRALLAHFDVHTPLVALHEHNEFRRSPQLIEQLRAGGTLALICDAGTPSISDPGGRLVALAHEQGVRVIPIPGPSAVICALSACGLSTERFAFEGFLPARAAARRARIESLRGEGRTLIFYEAPHRLAATLRDLAQILGAGRPATLARELTKVFETIRRDALGSLAEWVAADADQRKGEAVIVVEGAADDREAAADAARRVLTLLLEELPLKRAVALAAAITGEGRNRLYELALELRGPLR